MLGDWKIHRHEFPSMRISIELHRANNSVIGSPEWNRIFIECDVIPPVGTKIVVVPVAGRTNAFWREKSLQIKPWESRHEFFFGGRLKSLGSTFWKPLFHTGSISKLKPGKIHHPILAGWWFQIFFMFTPTWGRFPIWLIFFNWVETTN